MKILEGYSSSFGVLNTMIYNSIIKSLEIPTIPIAQESRDMSDEELSLMEAGRKA